MCVNISHTRRTQVEKKLEDLETPLERDLFDDAIRDAKDLLYRDSYFRFRAERIKTQKNKRGGK